MMKYRSATFLVFALILASASSSAPEENHMNQKDINNNFVKLYEKFAYLSEKVEKLELNSSTGNRAIEINYKEIMKKQDKFEQLLLQLIDNNINKRETREIKVEKVRSQCNSMCESRVTFWANQRTAQLIDKLDVCIDDLTLKPSCEPNPCMNGGQCKLTVTGSGYECVKCPYPTTGKRCEHLECSAENRCWRYADTLYVVFEENITWEQAFSKCEAEGMRMVMPKDQSSTEFLVQALKTVYQESELKHFWLGLKAEGSVYRWVDGTLLGDYLGGKPDFKSTLSDSRPIIGLHGGGSTYWWHIRLSEMSYYTHYPLCERRI